MLYHSHAFEVKLSTFQPVEFINTPKTALEPKSAYVLPRKRMSKLLLLHIHHTPDAVTRLHVLERRVDTAQVLAVCNELVDLELAGHVVVHQTWELGAALDTAEGAAGPAASGD